MHSKLLSWGSLALIAVALVGCSKQAKLERHLTRGDEAFKAGDYDRARIEFLNVIRIESTNLLAIQRLGTIFLEGGQLLQAAPFINRAKETEPNNVEFRVKMAQVYLGAGDLNNARKEALVALEKSPANEDAVLMLAEMPGRTNDLAVVRQQLQKARQQVGEKAVFHMADAISALRQKDRAAAEAAVQKALAADPKSAAAHFAMGGLEWARTNLAAAEQEFSKAVELSALRSARRLRYAEFLLRTKGRDVAKAYLEDLSKQAPDYLPALAMQADWAFTERRIDDCKKLTDTILGRYPAHLQARLLRSRILVGQGEAQKAIDELEGLSRVYGRVPDFRYQLAAAYLLNKDTEKAVVNLNQALAVYPDHSDSVLLLARIHIAQGKFDDAITPLTLLLKERPDVEATYLLLAEAYRGRRQLDDSLAVYRAYTKNFPKDPQGPFLAGLTLRQQKKDAEARRAFEQSLALEPKFLLALAQLVDMDVDAKDVPAALRRAQQAVAAMPDLAGTHFLLARVYLVNKDTANAKVALRKTIEIDPAVREPYLILAQIYNREGDSAKALRELEVLLDKNPGEVAALMLEGAIHSQRGDHGKARDSYEALLKVKPDFTPAHNNLAYLYAENLNDPERAYSLARRARAAVPNDPTVADTLGWVHYRRGEYQEALRLLLESAEKQPSIPEIQYHLGMAYYMLAQPAPARAALEQALNLAKSGEGDAVQPWIAEAQKRLAALQTDGQSTADSVDRLEKLVKENPNDLLSLTRLAQAYETQQAYSKAKATCEQILKLNPRSAEATIQLARLNAEHLNNPAEALRLAKRARELAPADAEVALALGSLAAEAGDPAWALSLLQEASRKLGDRPDVLLGLAKTTYLVGKIDEAAELAQKAQKTGGSTAATNEARQLEWLIQAYRNPASAAAQAEPQLQAMLEKSPDNVAVLMAMGGVHQQKGRADQARDLYEKALERAPRFGPARKELAVLYAGALKDDRKAYDMAVKARESLPADPVVARTLGMLNYRRGDHRYAVQLLTEAARGLPTDGELHFTLGMAHSQLKQTQEATAALNKALELGPQAPYAAEAKRVRAEVGGGR